MHKNQSYQLKCDIDSSQYHKFNWITYLKETNSEAAPIDHFPTAPAYEYAKNIKPNIAVEILNPEKANSFWIGIIKEVHGYKVLVHYLGTENYQLWLSIGEIYPVGHCNYYNKNLENWVRNRDVSDRNIALNGVNSHMQGAVVKENNPCLPKNIAKKLEDSDYLKLEPLTEVSKNYPSEKSLEKLLTTALRDYETLPADFKNSLGQNPNRRSAGILPLLPIQPLDRLEVVDTNKLDRCVFRAAYITEILPGGRIQVNLQNNLSFAPKPISAGTRNNTAHNDENRFWTNINSSLVHPIGFAFKIGHDVSLDGDTNLSPRDIELYKNPKSNPQFTNQNLSLNLSTAHTHNSFDLSTSKANEQDEKENRNNENLFRNAPREAFVYHRKMKALSKSHKRTHAGVGRKDSDSLVKNKKIKIADTNNNNLSNSYPDSPPSCPTSPTLLKVRSLSGETSNRNNLSPEPPLQIQSPDSNIPQFEVGMKLEAVDPLNLSCISPATVKKVLKRDWLIIKIDGTLVEFCYHSKSSRILPPGFCQMAEIPLAIQAKIWPVNKYFTWEGYLTVCAEEARKKHQRANSRKNSGQNNNNSKNQSHDDLTISPKSDHGTHKNNNNNNDLLAPFMPKLAPLELFSNKIPDKQFQVGQKLEAVDLIQPNLICVATVKQVVCKLIRIGFDGWGSDYDQWIDCESPDIYPVGYAEFVGEKLQPLGQPKKESSGSGGQYRNDANSKKRISPVMKNNKVKRK